MLKKSTLDARRLTRREWGALLGIVCLALLLRLWNISLGGFGSEYYSAAVRSMLENVHNFFFDSFDPAGFVTVDKPPLALWIQCLSAALFGFSGPAILLPQAIEGTVSVALLFILVARSIGNCEALIASLLLAINPVSVAVDRSSNVESCLVLLLLLSCLFFTIALESGRLRYLLLTMVFVAAAFNTKFLAGWIIAPVFLSLYLLRTQEALQRRLRYFAVAVLVLLATSLAWISVFDLFAPPSRPQVAKTLNNSMYELAFATYGIEVVEGHGSEVNLLQGSDSNRPRSAFFDDVDPGFARLVDRHLAGQTSWFAPLAVFGLLLALGMPGLAREKRWALAVWIGWALFYGAAFMYDRGTFHGYYLAAIAPPAAVLASVGLIRVMRAERAVEQWLLGVLFVTALWQIYIESEVGFHLLWIPIAMIVLSMVGIGLALTGTRFRVIGIAVASAGLMIAPSAWALSNVAVLRVNTLTPTADIFRFTGAARNRIEYLSSGYGVATDDPKLFSFLQENATSETFILATPNARLAAPIIIHTGKPVMALGGFSGQDRLMNADELKAMVKAGRIRYLLLGSDLDFGVGADNRERARQFVALAEQIGQQVDPALWRSPRPNIIELIRSGAPLRLQGSRSDLYDLKPSKSQ